MRHLAGDPEPTTEDQLATIQGHLVITLAQEHTEEAISTLAWIMRGAPVGKGKKQVLTAKVRERKDAAIALLDRGWPKPHQLTAKPVGNDGGRGVKIQIMQIGTGGTVMVQASEDSNEPDHTIPTPGEAALSHGVTILPPDA